jgi:hypothetical protein
MVDYVQVPVPASLVPQVMRLVADHLADDAGPGEAHSFAGWDVLVSEDDEEAGQWWRMLRPDERRLLRTLAAAPGDSLETSDAARNMKLTSQDLAGILGPMNRRARRDGYPAPVRSRQERSRDKSGRRVTVLCLEQGVATIMERHDIGEPPYPPVKKRRPTPGSPADRNRR